MSVDKILLCDHSNEALLRVVSQCFVRFLAYYETKFGKLENLSISVLATRGSESVKVIN